MVMITPLITSPYIARILGADNIGIYTYCNAYALYFFIFAMLGVNDYGNRTIAKSRDDKERLSENFWQIYYLQFFLTTISLLLYVISILFFTTDYHIVRLILLAYVASAFFDVNWFAFGMEEFKFTSVRNVIIRLLIVFAIFSFVKTEQDITIYTSILVLGNFFSNLPLWFLVLKKTKIKKPSFRIIVGHIKPNLILFFPVIATTIYQQIDKLMLGYSSETSEVGFYQNAENVVTLLTFFTTAIVTVMLPHISNLISQNKYLESIDLTKKTLFYSTLLNIAMTFGLASIASIFIPWFLGVGFERSADLVKILSPIIIVSGVSNIVRYGYLIPKEMDKVFSSSIMLGAVLNIILNLFFIPKYQAEGAAYATIAAYSFVMFFQMFFSYKEINYLKIFVQTIPYFFLGVVMFVVVYLINLKLNFSTKAIIIAIDVFMGGGIYLIGCLVLFEITKNNDYHRIKMSLLHQKVLKKSMNSMKHNVHTNKNINS